MFHSVNGEIGKAVAFRIIKRPGEKTVDHCVIQSVIQKFRFAVI